MDNQAVDGARVLARVAWRIIPLLGLAYLIAFMDRLNISFAAATMNADLGFSATVYGIGGGVFFASYALFEIPSNVLLQRVGARVWIARIMVSWGLVATAMMFVRAPWQFYGARFALGLCEAGFFPAVIHYLSQWFPQEMRARAISRFYMFGALTKVVIGVVSVWLLGLNGVAGLRGWQWVFIGEGLPAVVVGLVVLSVLSDTPARARWLTGAEKQWLAARLSEDAQAAPVPGGHALGVLRKPALLLLSAFGLLAMGSYYSFALSEPQILVAKTGWALPQVGWCVSLGGVIGLCGMLTTGWLADRTDRKLRVLGLSTALVMTAYILIAIATGPVVALAGYALLAAAWPALALMMVVIAADLVSPVEIGVAVAMVNTVCQVGAFFGPIGWGMARDATGSFTAGLWALVVALALALGLASLLAWYLRPARRGRLPVAA